MVASELQVSEPVLVHSDTGKAELEEDLEEFECTSDDSGSVFSEATEWLGSVGEGGDGWLGIQMYQAKEALSRRTLNNILADVRHSFTNLYFSPVLFTALRFSSFSILVVIRCPPFSSF